jgi:hypothetical protein
MPFNFIYDSSVMGVPKCLSNDTKQTFLDPAIHRFLVVAYLTRAKGEESRGTIGILIIQNVRMCTNQKTLAFDLVVTTPSFMSSIHGNHGLEFVWYCEDT